MKEPSDTRKRTLALQDRALKFSDAVNTSCPEHFTNKPSAIVWDQLVRAADGTSSNLIEADAASSDADFLFKMGVGRSKHFKVSGFKLSRNLESKLRTQL